MPVETLESLTLNIVKEIQIAAPMPAVFESVLEQIGPGMSGPNGELMHGKVEPWPGGRWYRDLGNNTGHFWGHVQVMKPPTLLELCGPMFMSYAAVNFVQYRLKEQGRGTLLTLTHRALGDLIPEHREGVQMGWQHFMDEIKRRAEK